MYKMNNNIKILIFKRLPSTANQNEKINILNLYLLS